jgi:cation diffusion facilitator CzcD-associated flavoprotein CzcO
MLAPGQDIAAAVESWLAQFEGALGEEARLKALFHAESHWRDVLALTWRIGTVNGAEAITRELKSFAAQAKPREFRIDPDRTPPRLVTRTKVETIEAIFRFETAVGTGNGVLRLTPDAKDGKTFRAWTLLTALDQIEGHEEHIGAARPHGESYSRDFRGPNWLDLRKEAAAYKDRDPAVLVVGGGQAGLSIAARLGALGVDALIVDRWPRIGDNWRRRYHALTLHNQVHVNHMPYMPFPPNWPVYIPKDKLANWFEAYAEAMELNYWPATEFTGGAYDEKAKRWTVTLRRADGSTRAMHPRHIVMATGVSDIPNTPDIPGLKDFSGTVLHAAQYQDGEPWSGKNAIVIGSGNSGHDIAQDLYSAGAKVAIVQRGSTMIVEIEPSAQLPYVLYDEGLALDDTDLITVGVPLTLAKKAHQAFTAQARALDKPLLDRLARVGFKLDFGDDGLGWQFKYLTRGGGYYFNVGCSDLIADGKIRLLQFSDIGGFSAGGARMKSGETIAADLVVLATGYKGPSHLMRKLFGDAVADCVGPVWGYGEDEELRNMFKRTPQDGLWFIGGSFAQCRIYSKYLGLQIKASELGLMP